MKLLSRVRHNEIVENIGAYLPGGSLKRKLLEMKTSTPATKKKTKCSISSQNDSLSGEFFNTMANSTFQESGYSSFSSV